MREDQGQDGNSQLNSLSNSEEDVEIEKEEVMG